MSIMLSYETIDINDYIQSGEGGTALSYRHKTRNTLAKLYKPGFEAERAISEFLTARTVYEMGIPTPEPIRLVTDGERYGAEYAFIPGKRSFTRIISEEPGRLEEISLEFARLTRELHSFKADTSRLRSYKQTLQNFYRERDLVPADYKDRALKFLEPLPDTPTCLHGDLQIGNIITDETRTLWIDVGEFSYGLPEWDLGVMWTVCHNMRAELAQFLFHVQPETLTRHWDIFLPAYLGTRDRQTLEAYNKRLLPFYAVKVPYVYDMAYHSRMPDTAFQRLTPILP